MSTTEAKGVASEVTAEQRRSVFEKIRSDVEALLLPSTATSGSASESSVSEPVHHNAAPPEDMAYVTHLANISSIIFHELNAMCDESAQLQRLPVNWVGFYLLTSPQVLTLGPFQGKVACTQIKIGKGVCGMAALHGKPLAVSDVHKYPGHIACDGSSCSEIVVPIRSPQNNDRLVGLLDIDSSVTGFFSDADAPPLQAICDVIGNNVTFPIAMKLTKALGAADAPKQERQQQQPQRQPHQQQHEYHEHPTKPGAVRHASNTGSGVSFFTYTGKDLIQDARPSTSVKVVRGWSLQVTRLDRLMPSDKFDALGERLGIHALPEILFEHNAFVFTHKSSGVALSVSLEDVLRSCKAFYNSAGYQKYISGEACDPLEIPSAKKWKGRRASHTLFLPGIDWAMRNTFSGAWFRGDAAVDLEEHRCRSGADATATDGEGGKAPRKVDYERLKDQTREILFYDSFDLFEDELHDCGTTQFSAKFRVMDDCFFVLLRHFIRVDGVAAVARDTRIYHEFAAAGATGTVGEGGSGSGSNGGVIVVECTERELPLEPIDMTRDTNSRRMHANRNIDEIYAAMKVKREELFNIWL